jgi:hypothetical protein
MITSFYLGEEVQTPKGVGTVVGLWCDLNTPAKEGNAVVYFAFKKGVERFPIQQLLDIANGVPLQKSNHKP